MKNAEILHKLVWLVALVSLAGQASDSSEPKYPLERAARDGDVEVTKRLLTEGQSQYLRDSALTFAIQAGHREIMELLISGGARYALMRAAEKGDVRLVEDLLARGPGTDERDSALHAAVRTGHKEVVELLLSQGANVDALRWGDFTPLFFAVTAGGDFDALSHFRTFPLFPGSVQLTRNKRSSAAPERYIGIIELLVKHGADINSKDKNDETPLGAAVFRGQKETVSLLLSHGADVNAAYTKECEFRGGIPLHIAVRWGHFEIARMLVLEGANVNAVGLWEGVTPLHMALKDKALLELMLEHGGQINSRSTGGVTCLHLAAQAGQDDLVRYLIARGASVNVQDRKGNTPLHLAAKTGQRSSCNVLIAGGADINLRNNKGLLPVDYAEASGIEEVFADGRAAPGPKE